MYLHFTCIYRENVEFTFNHTFMKWIHKSRNALPPGMNLNHFEIESQYWCVLRKVYMNDEYLYF